MASGAAQINSTIKIGSATVVVAGFLYGGSWVSSTATVDGVVNQIVNGITNITVKGIILEFYRENTVGAAYGATGHGILRCRFKNTFNSYSEPWTPVDGEEFFSISSTTVSGSDQRAMSNVLTTKLPILREVLL